MPLVMDVNEARQGRQILAVDGYTRKTNDKDNYFLTMYMGAPPATVPDQRTTPNGDRTMPQAYLVEQPAESTLPAHYHDTNQYQVFIAGGVVFGKKPIGALSVHFAGGHTPYGPIFTKDAGTHFFTLRAHWDSGGKPMPESRQTLQPVKRVYRMAADVEIDGRDCNEVIPTEESGLGTSLFNVAPGETKTLELPVAGGGQYALVLGGAVTHAAAELAVHSCLYRYPDEAPITLTAGNEGATVLLLQFPRQEPLESLAAKN